MNIWKVIFEITALCTLALIATSLVLGLVMGCIVYFCMALIGFYTYLSPAVEYNGYLNHYTYWNIHYEYE